MKTLKSISLTILFCAVVVFASAKETSKMLITSSDDLRQSFKELIVSDFTETTGFLSQNDINKLNEKVEVIFLITPEQKIEVLTVKCKNQLASEYVKQLLNKETLNVKSNMIGKTYRISISLVYQSF